MADTCGSCKHYIGGGDWNLCCSKMYDLCYEQTPACDMYEYSEAKVLELKEQEPVKTEPVRFRIVRAGGNGYPFWDCVCDGCGFKTHMVHTNWRFCPECGRKVKWDATD